MSDPTDFTLIRDALTIAERWLANSLPVVELDGPKPLPVIRQALAALSASGAGEQTKEVTRETP